MASWQGNYDSAANTPYWTAATVNKAPTTTEAQRLYGNTTANSYTTGETTGVFAVDDNEVQVAGAPHAGWIRRVTGSGGRAGRVTQEVLSVVAAFRSDNDSDDSVYPDAAVTITLQPESQSLYFDDEGANSVTFSVEADTLPVGSVVTYNWEVNDGVEWLDVLDGESSNTTYDGNTTSELTVTPTDVDSNTYVYRVTVTSSPTGGTAVSETSANATITILAP